MGPLVGNAGDSEHEYRVVSTCENKAWAHLLSKGESGLAMWDFHSGEKYGKYNSHLNSIGLDLKWVGTGPTENGNRSPRVGQGTKVDGKIRCTTPRCVF